MSVETSESGRTQQSALPVVLVGPHGPVARVAEVEPSVEGATRLEAIATLARTTVALRREAPQIDHLARQRHVRGQHRPDARCDQP